MSNKTPQLAPNRERYEAIKHLYNDFVWSYKSGYAHKDYVAVAKTDEAKALSSRDVALLADHGNLCFGGRNFRKNIDTGTFSGTIHTD